MPTHYTEIAGGYSFNSKWMSLLHIQLTPLNECLICTRSHLLTRSNSKHIISFQLLCRISCGLNQCKRIQWKRNQNIVYCKLTSLNSSIPKAISPGNNSNNKTYSMPSTSPIVSPLGWEKLQRFSVKCFLMRINSPHSWCEEILYQSQI